MNSAEVYKINARIAWLKSKETEMRRVGGPDYTPNALLRGRVQGEIGGLKWILKEFGPRP
jgi:hypothetical protein